MPFFHYLAWNPEHSNWMKFSLTHFSTPARRIDLVASTVAGLPTTVRGWSMPVISSFGPSFLAISSPSLERCMPLPSELSLSCRWPAFKSVPSKPKLHSSLPFASTTKLLPIASVGRLGIKPTLSSHLSNQNSPKSSYSISLAQKSPPKPLVSGIPLVDTAYCSSS